MNNNERIRVEVIYSREGESSFGVLVDLILNSEGKVSGGSRLEWFPKQLCELERIDFPEEERKLPEFYLTAPKWLLDKKNVRIKK